MCFECSKPEFTLHYNTDSTTTARGKLYKNCIVIHFRVYMCTSVAIHPNLDITNTNITNYRL